MLVLANLGLRELVLRVSIKLRVVEVMEADSHGAVSSCEAEDRLAESASPEPVRLSGDLRALPTALKIQLSISAALSSPSASSSFKVSGVCISESLLFRFCATCFFLELNVHSAGRGLGKRLLLPGMSGDGGLSSGVVLIDDDPEEEADVTAELDVKASVRPSGNAIATRGSASGNIGDDLLDSGDSRSGVSISGVPSMLGLPKPADSLASEL